VGKCNNLPAAGTWEEVTPPQVKAQLPGSGNCTYGVDPLGVDPVHSGTVYFGSCNMGIWKSTDCGSNWTHINTGRNGSTLDTGRQWTWAIDPMNPDVLYTNSGYGASSNGAFKSTNGGVDWDPLWPPADPNLQNVVAYNFVSLVEIDPLDHNHLLLSFHATCNPPYAAACFAESLDAGGTWRVVNGRPDWFGGEASIVYFLDGGGTWIFASQTNGLWRTADSGKTWTQVYTNVGGHNSTPVYRAKDGAFYLALTSGTVRSPDGITWTQVQNQTNLGITGNGTTMYSSVGFPWNPGSGPPPYMPFWMSPEADGKNWIQVQSPLMSNGGAVGYDNDHHILYSANLDAGFWRAILP
jgi:hypothetical protein